MRFFIPSIFLFFLTCGQLKAQLHEFGVHVAFVQSQLTPQEGAITEFIFVREGISKPGAAFGIQYSIGQPRNQNKVGWDPRYWVMVETSFARTGGNFSVAQTLSGGDRTLLNLNYTFYRLDLTPKFILGSKKIRFYLGPAVSRILYAGVRVDQESSAKSATSDFNSFSVGYEGGVGMALNKFQFSIRTLRYVTDYGRSFSGNSMAIKNNEIRIFLSLKLKEKHKGAYWDSIDWDN